MFFFSSLIIIKYVDVVVVSNYNNTTLLYKEQQELFEATSSTDVFYRTSFIHTFCTSSTFYTQTKTKYCHEINIDFGDVIGYVCHSAYFDVIATVFGCWESLKDFLTSKMLESQVPSTTLSIRPVVMVRVVVLGAQWLRILAQ